MTGKQVALVTGASSGIGKSIAISLGEQGFRVFGTSRKEQPLAASPSDLEFVQLDVRDDKSVDLCVQKVLSRAGRIDALVNNAGCFFTGALEETSIDEAKTFFDTNLFGIFRMNNAILPYMRKQGYGRIAIISSVVGLLPMPYAGLYSASKHAVEGYSESLDHEVRQFGIRVSLIEPGFMRTDIGRHAQRAGCRIEAYSEERDQVIAMINKSIESGDDPSVVASIVHRALTSPSPRLRYLAGRQAKLLVVGKWLFPARIFDKLARKQFGMS